MSDQEQPVESPLRPKVLAEFQGLLNRLHNQPAAKMLWDEVLTEEQKKRLGGDFETAYDGMPGAELMLAKARGIARDLAILDAARELRLLDSARWRQLNDEVLKAYPLLTDYRAGEPLMLSAAPERIVTAFEEASHRKRLVILACQGNGSVSWRGTVLGVDWGKHPMLWHLLVALAQAAEGGRSVDRLVADARKPDTLKHRVCRLRKLIRTARAEEALKVEFADAIQPAGEAATYRIVLPKDEVEVIMTEPEAHSANTW